MHSNPNECPALDILTVPTIEAENHGIDSQKEDYDFVPSSEASAIFRKISQSGSKGMVLPGLEGDIHTLKHRCSRRGYDPVRIRGIRWNHHLGRPRFVFLEELVKEKVVVHVMVDSKRGPYHQQ